MRLSPYWLMAGLFVSASVLAVEDLGYEVVSEQDDFEIRRYDAHVLATVTVDAAFEEAGNRAFRTLFTYIDGANAADENIAMTAPVLQEPAGDNWDISFVMPASYDAATVPAPDAERIKLEAEPQALMAAITYSGNWSRQRYLQKEDELRSAIADAGYEACDEPKFARHNPPFWPAFMRKNEVLIPLCANDEGPR